LADYKNFVQNGGFGPAFGSVDHLKYEEKVRFLFLFIYLFDQLVCLG
jgi:hypothetical protein